MAILVFVYVSLPLALVRARGKPIRTQCCVISNFSFTLSCGSDLMAPMNPLLFRVRGGAKKKSENGPGPFGIPIAVKAPVQQRFSSRKERVSFLPREPIRQKQLGKVEALVTGQTSLSRRKQQAAAYIDLHIQTRLKDSDRDRCGQHVDHIHKGLFPRGYAHKDSQHHQDANL